MRSRIFALAAVAGLFLNIIGFAAADTHAPKAKKRQSSRLVSLLPASDGVAVFDSNRFLNDALPKVLSANQPMLGEIMAKISEIENRTGIDLRKFDQVAVGVALKQVSATETDYQPVFIASGDISAGALLAVAKLASGGTYREEKIGQRTVFVFTPKAVVQKAAVKTTHSKIANAVDHMLKGLSKEIAVTAIDKNTIAVGTLGRVRETLEGRSHVGSDVSGLLSATETSVLSFSARTGGNLSKLVPYGEYIGTNGDAIQYLSGSLDINTVGATLQLMARTKTATQAAGVKDMLDVGQSVFGGILAASKRADQQVYERLLKSSRIEVRGADVTLDLLVPQSDIDLLVAGIK